MASVVNSLNPSMAATKQPVEKPVASAVARVCCAIGECFRNLGYVAFVVGVVGFALASASVIVGGAAALKTVPAYLAIAGGASHLLGIILQNLGSKNVSCIQ